MLDDVEHITAPRDKCSKEEIVTQHFSQQRISVRLVGESVDVSFPQKKEPILEVDRIIPHERVHQRTVEQFGESSLLQLVGGDLVLELILDRDLTPCEEYVWNLKCMVIGVRSSFFMWLMIWGSGCSDAELE